MKSVETVIKYVLIVVFMSCLCVDVLLHIIPSFPTHSYMLRFLPCCMLVGVTASSIFPLWNVSKYLNRYNTSDIMKYKRRYKLQFTSLGFGFLGALLVNIRIYPTEFGIAGDISIALFGLLLIVMCIHRTFFIKLSEVFNEN